MIDSGVGNNDHSGFLEGLGDVIGEVTGGESTGNGLSTGETSHLEDSSVTVGSGRDDGDVCGVLDGGEDSGSEDELLPGLADIEDVDTWILVGKRFGRCCCCWCLSPGSYPHSLRLRQRFLPPLDNVSPTLSIPVQSSHSIDPYPPSSSRPFRNHSPSALRL